MARDKYLIDNFNHLPHVIPGATTSDAGVLTAVDKTKLDGLSASIALQRVVRYSSTAPLNAAAGDFIIVFGTLETAPHVTLPPASIASMVAVKNYTTGPTVAVVVQPGEGDTVENTTQLQLTALNSAAVFVSDGVSNWAILSRI